MTHPCCTANRRCCWFIVLHQQTPGKMSNCVSFCIHLQHHRGYCLLFHKRRHCRRKIDTTSSLHKPNEAVWHFNTHKQPFLQLSILCAATRVKNDTKWKLYWNLTTYQTILQLWLHFAAHTIYTILLPLVCHMLLLAYTPHMLIST